MELHIFLFCWFNIHLSLTFAVLFWLVSVIREKAGTAIRDGVSRRHLDAGSLLRVGLILLHCILEVKRSLSNQLLMRLDKPAKDVFVVSNLHYRMDTVSFV